MNFKEKLQKIVQKNNSLLCVGLDIDKDRLPQFLYQCEDDPYFVFNRGIIDQTKDVVCAYKLNMAFYEALGINGYTLLEKTIDYIPDEIVVILDGKRNDIGNTAKKYARSLFEVLSADAVTVNPYLGFDSVKPFVDYKDKCSFILCRTSNPSAVDFQDLSFSNKKMYEIVADKIKEWNTFYNLGAVVGATYPNELKNIRKILGEESPILIPGIGKQGGDVQKTVQNGTNKDGEMAVINSSRGIIYAGDGENFAQESKKQAVSLRDEINKYR